jgi:hypothetical protein
MPGLDNSLLILKQDNALVVCHALTGYVPKGIPRHNSDQLFSCNTTVKIVVYVFTS